MVGIRVGSSAALWKVVMENHFCAVGRGQLALPEHRKQIFLGLTSQGMKTWWSPAPYSAHTHHQSPRPITPGCFPSTREVLSPGWEEDMELCFLPSQGDLPPSPCPRSSSSHRRSCPKSSTSRQGHTTALVGKLLMAASAAPLCALIHTGHGWDHLQAQTPTQDSLSSSKLPQHSPKGSSCCSPSSSKIALFPKR